MVRISFGILLLKFYQVLLNTDSQRAEFKIFQMLKFEQLHNAMESLPN